MNTTSLQLPAGTHATVLTGRDIVTGEQLAYPVVWTDRPYDECPRCGQPVAREIDCPVMLNPGAGQGGAIEPLSQQHGCGLRLNADWTELACDASDADILAATVQLSAQLAEQINAARNRIRARLRRELTWTLDRLAEPLDSDETVEDRAEEVRSGSDMDPVGFQKSAWGV